MKAYPIFKRREFLKLTGSTLAMLPLGIEPGPVSAANRSISTRPIPSSGEALPIVGFGNSAAFKNGDLVASSPLLDVLIEMGGGFVDTGGKSQVLLGQYMKEHAAHSQLFLGSNIFSAETEKMLSEIKIAQQAQGKISLDLVWLRRLQNLDRQWDDLLQWKHAGLTRYAGFAMSRQSYYEPVMKLMETGTMDFVQVNYSMLEPQAASSVLPLAREQGVAVITNRPFINGQYFPLVSGRELPEWARDFDCNSWAQFSLKYILANPAINCVLTETTRKKHAVDNLSAGFGRLPDESTRQRMTELFRSFIPAGGA